MTAKIKTSPVHRTSSHRHKPKGVSRHAFEKVYWPYIPIILLASTLIMFAAQNGVLRTMLKHPAQSVLAYATSINQKDLLTQTNLDRSANHQKPLKLNAELSRAAQSKANDMALRDYWSHNTPAGNPPWVFVTATGYQYDKLGENLAAGFSDSKATVAGWMASPEHRENMLDSAYTEVGFGFANNPNYTAAGGGPMTIVVAFYGQPSPPDVSLDNNAVALAAASNLNSQPPATTSRAQLALATSPFANYATLISLMGLVAVATLWVSRHLLMLRRTFVRGESFVMSHPLFDFGMVLLGLAFFALSRTAGFIL